MVVSFVEAPFGAPARVITCNATQPRETGAKLEQRAGTERQSIEMPGGRRRGGGGGVLVDGGRVVGRGRASRAGDPRAPPVIPGLAPGVSRAWQELHWYE